MAARFKFPVFLRSCLFLALVLVAGTPGARAADDPTAARLRTVLQGILDNQKNAIAASRARLTTNGDLTIEPAGSYYAATLPGMSLTYPDGTRVDIGMIAINATPADKPGLWKMAIATPTPITAYDNANQAVFTIDIGGQRATGLWEENFANFVKLDARYENIKFRGLKTGTEVTIPVISATYDLKQGADGNWSGPLDVEIDNLQATVEGGKASVAKIVASSEWHDLSAAAIKDYREKMQAMAESMQGLQAAGQAMSPQSALGIYNMVFDFLGVASSGFNSKLSLEGLDVASPPDAKGETTHVALAKAGFGFGMDGFRANRVRLGVQTYFDGLNIAPAPEYSEFSPNAMNIDISVNNLPYKELVAMGRQMIEASIKSPQSAQMMRLQAMATLPGLFTQAGTNLALNNNSIAGPGYAAKLDGTLTADAAAVKGVAGEIRTEITGLDTLTTAMSAKIQDPKTGPAEKTILQKQLQGLAVMQTLGQQGTNAQGQPVRSYDFVINRQGQILLNGTDMNALMGTMGGAPGMAAPSAP